MINDGRGPFDGVDLGQQRGTDEPGMVEQLIVRPGRVLRAEAVTDGVVLEGEERVQHRQTDPEPGHVGWMPVVLAIGARSDVWQAVGIDSKLAVDPGPYPPLKSSVAAVDLRRVPPVCFGVDEGGGSSFVSRGTRRVRDGSEDGHWPLVLRPIVVGSERQFPWWLTGV